MSHIFLEASPYLIWGFALHLIVDWLAQNEWIATNKANRRRKQLTMTAGEAKEKLVVNDPSFFRFLEDDDLLDVGRPVDRSWWDRHPAAYVHAAMHGAIQLLVFPWRAALAIGVTHFLIDLRKPVEWWSKLIRQTQPAPIGRETFKLGKVNGADQWYFQTKYATFDVGSDVRIWADQVWHIAVIALVALAVSI